MLRLDKDHIFKNEFARAGFRKYIKHDGSSADETSISELIRFDAVMTNAIDLAEFVISSDFTSNSANVEAASQRIDVLLSRTIKGGAEPQDSIRNLKLMLPIGASTILTFSFKRFSECCVG